MGRVRMIMVTTVAASLALWLVSGQSYARGIYDEEVDNCNVEKPGVSAISGFASLRRQDNQVEDPIGTLSDYRLVPQRDGKPFQFRSSDQEPLRFFASFPRPKNDVPPYAWTILSIPRPFEGIARSEPKWDAIISADSERILNGLDRATHQALLTSFKVAKDASSTYADNQGRRLATFNLGDALETIRTANEEWVKMVGDWPIRVIFDKLRKRQPAGHTSSGKPIIYQHTVFFHPIFRNSTDKMLRFVSEIRPLVDERTFAYGFVVMPHLGCVSAQKILLNP